MKIIKIEDKEYPEKLRNIYDPPKELYVMGDHSILNNFGIGIVGTRKASKYGIQITKSLSYGLARKEINIISGLAKGIDTAAHQGTLLAKGKTIAVIAGGFDYIYPKENISLMWNIINSGGAIITEHKKDEKPEAKNFPKRNRIISGLSNGIIVTEAPEKSGSLITAELALEQGKEIFAVPRKRTIKKLKRHKYINKKRRKTHRKHIRRTGGILAYQKIKQRGKQVEIHRYNRPIHW